MTEVLPEHYDPGTAPLPTAQALPPAAMPAHPPLTVPAPDAGHAILHASQRDGASIAHRGREKLHWSKEVWDCLDAAVRRECKRTRVAAKFLPIHKVAEHTTTVPADVVIEPPTSATSTPRWSANSAPPPTVTTDIVDEGADIRLIEFWVEFSLTPQQVEHEANTDHSHHLHGQEHDDHTRVPGHHPNERDSHGHEHNSAGHSTVVTLATRAANVLAQAEDMIVFNGYGAFSTPLFSNANVRWRPNGLPNDLGMLDVPVQYAAPPFIVQPLPGAQVISVQPAPPTALMATVPPYTYLQNTFMSVAAGYSQLMGNGQYGPFALTLPPVCYADTHSPLASTLILTADRIHPLMTAGFRDSGTLDAPGYQAAVLGASAAANAPAGTGGAAAANAAASFAVNYGLPLATAGYMAQQAAGIAGDTTAAAKSDAQAAVFAAASAIPNYQNLPATPTGITIGTSGPPSFYGSLVSLGGNTMDYVRGIDATVGFMQQDTDGSYRFRVFQRGALRIKNIKAVIRLEFV
jgi:hypothetical protein